MPIKPMYVATFALRLDSDDSRSTHAPGLSALNPHIRKAMHGELKDDDAPPVFCANRVKIQFHPTKIADGAPTYFDNISGKVSKLANAMIVRLLRVSVLGLASALFLGGANAVAGPVGDLLAERHHVTEGGLNGFFIGEDKVAAYRHSVDLKVYGIEVLTRPVQQVRFDNLDQLYNFDSSDFIRVTNYRNLTFDLHFEQDVLKQAKVIGSPSNEYAKLPNGQSFASTMGKLRTMLQLDHSLIAYSFSTGNQSRPQRHSTIQSFKLARQGSLAF
jgi:hypothetical protein